MKIQFDIKYRPQIESGEYKVETRDGRPARIICWDRIATEPYDNCTMVALTTGTKSKSESAYYYYQDGHLWNKANGEGDSPLDLFIITPESDTLEKAAEEYATKWHKNPDGSEWKPYFEVSAIKAFIAGAQWQKDTVNIDISKQIAAAFQLGGKDMKEQMMKDAVECVVCAGMEGDKWIMTYIGSYESMLKACQTGDKVRIIIVKEEG